MNYQKIITVGLGFLLGLVVYNFIKKALNGNGSVSVAEEETAGAIGLKGLRIPRVQKAGSCVQTTQNPYPMICNGKCISCATNCKECMKVRREHGITTEF